MFKLFKPQRLLTFIFFIIFITGAFTSVFAQWEGWNYRRTVTISNTSGSDLTDYQTKIVLNSSTPFDFTKANSDGSDLRVTDYDQLTAIPFWIESWNAVGNTATIWVKIPNIPTTGTTVYLYYGNIAALRVSNGSATFRFFDDFELWISGSTGWQDKAPLPTAIADLTTAVYNGKLYCFGGYGNGPNNPVDKNYEYDPTTNAWTEKTAMPTARWGMAAVEFDGLIYVFGGSISSGAGNVDKNEVYDPVLNSWTTKAVIPTNLARQGVMGVRFGNKIHLFYESYNYEYDPATDTYTQKANVPNPRFWCTSAVVGSKIYLIGGHHAGAANNDNQEYDPATDTWATKAPLPISLWGATRDNPVINGKIYVTHGLDGSSFHTSNYVYNPATNTWEQKGSAAHLRDGVGCGVINNKLYVIGGRADFGGPYGLVYNEVYDPSLDTWTPPGPTLWATSGTSYVFADASAKYQGNYGLVIQQLTDVATQRYAQSIEGFGSVYALDFDWQITDIGGIGSQPKPQGLITLTETDPTGSLYFYNSSGTPVVRWFNGSGFNHLQNSTWNNWHKLTVVRNGVNSRVVFDENQYQSPSITSPPLTGTGKIKFGIYFATTQYLDNVRVRSYSTIEPTTTVGGEVPNPLPVELNSFSALVIGSKVKLNWKTETEVSNYGFDVERKVGSRLSEAGNFEKIGFVEGNGNSNSPKYYSFEDNNLTAGKYSYRLKQIDTDGQFEYSKVIEINLDRPMKYELSQNYPNPFNPVTTIQFSIPEAGDVKLVVYNVLGEQVAELVNENKEAGVHTINFNAAELNSGLYIYKLTAGNFRAVKKLMLVK